MTTIDCSSEMTKFHAEKVTLQPSDQREMCDRRDAGRTRLQTGLTHNEHPQPKEIDSQGSYAMRTMVQDDDLDYDIDDGAYFDKGELIDQFGLPLTPTAAKERVRDALKRDQRLKEEAEVRNNCVRQRYPQGYHIDIAVYRIIKSICSGQLIPDTVLSFPRRRPVPIHY